MPPDFDDSEIITVGGDIDDSNDKLQLLRSALPGIRWVFYILFFVQQELVDGYDSGEFIERLVKAIQALVAAQQALPPENGEIPSPGEIDRDLIGGSHYFFYGLTIATLSSLLLTLTIRHYHNKGSHHGHHHAHTENSKFGHFSHELQHYLTIGIPFFMVGYGAFNEVILSCFPEASLGATLAPSILAGLLAGHAAKTLHGFHMDLHSHGEGWFGYLKSALRKFTVELQGFKDCWLKHGILWGHVGEGYFAATLFLKAIFANRIPWVSIPLTVITSVLIALFESVTEASSIDINAEAIQMQSHAMNEMGRVNSAKAFITHGVLTGATTLAGVLHALPVVMGGAELLELLMTTIARNMLESGAGNHAINNFLLSEGATLIPLTVATVFLLYPNALGFRQMINPAVEKAVKSLIKLDKHSKTGSEVASCKFSKIFCCGEKRRKEQPLLSASPESNGNYNYGM